MSYELCLQNQAEKPYYIENIRTEIYSLEELCFYLYNNMYLIDDSIMNEKLCDWVRDELKLPRLYRQMYDQLEKGEGAAMFVMPIFREAVYLNQQEMREYQEQLTRLEVQSEDTKQKFRGDYLVKEKMYARAIWEYTQILSRRNPGKLGNQFYAGILNNLGVAYAGLYQFERAAECFFEAWKQVRTKDTFRKYISALPLFLNEEEYRNRIKELDADSYLVAKIQEYNAGICSQSAFKEYVEQRCSGNTDELIDELKEAYCRSTKI